MAQPNSQTGIDKCIKKLNDFFVAEIMEGNYKIEKITDCIAHIVTDSGKKFCLWVANLPNNFNTYEGGYNFMALEFNAEEKNILHPRFRAYYEENQKKMDYLALKRRYEELKSEFE